MEKINGPIWVIKGGIVYMGQLSPSLYSRQLQLPKLPPLPPRPKDPQPPQPVEAKLIYPFSVNRPASQKDKDEYKQLSSQAAGLANTLAVIHGKGWVENRYAKYIVTIQKLVNSGNYREANSLIKELIIVLNRDVAMG